jgi:hypothetical protein
MAYRLTQSDATTYGLALKHPQVPYANCPGIVQTLHQLSIDQFDIVQLLLEHGCKMRNTPLLYLASCQGSLKATDNARTLISARGLYAMFEQSPRAE